MSSAPSISMSAAAPLGPPNTNKPLTPEMQSEVDALVFKPKRVSPAPTASSPPPLPPIERHSPRHATEQRRSPYLIESPGEEIEYVNSMRDNPRSDHWRGGKMVLESSRSDASLPFDPVYSDAHTTKDTDDHFGDGMVLDPLKTDVAMPFDPIYSGAHVTKDTDDHFGEGMILEAANASQSLTAEQMGVVHNVDNEEEKARPAHETAMRTSPAVGGATSASVAPLAPPAAEEPTEELNAFEYSFDRVFGAWGTKDTASPPVAPSIGPPGFYESCVPIDYAKQTRREDFLHRRAQSSCMALGASPRRWPPPPPPPPLLLLLLRAVRCCRRVGRRRIRRAPLLPTLAPLHLHGS